ncbi:O-antigen ligase family protein [Thiothrix nivea]|uniref:O-antigen polymerase n=1 Tax=Thiothrix nivea (strain ATCC 35100 / DSM 5205 / JP2) TaxID=870187 RepID=A0A656HMM9_THINJ|nr:O-antigen ligase family protein [Thiothrix nivea]EIJ36610.1 O-antigen polymerase [Thiothrix nivea DSM 5205]
MCRVVNVLIVVFIFSVPWHDMVEFPGVGTLARMLGAAAFVVGMGTILMNNRIRPLQGVHLWIGLFTLWVWLTLFWSVWPEKTQEYAFSMVQLFLFSILMWQFIRTREDLREAWQALVLGGYVLIFFTLQSWFSGHQASFNRYAAEGVNENELAAMLALGIPVALHLLMEDRNIGWKLINLLYIPAALSAIVLSASRTGFVIASVGSLYALVIFQRSRLAWRVITAVSVIGLIVALLPMIPQTSLDRLATIGHEASSGTLTGRTTIWKYGLLAWQEHPIVGHGLGAFRKAVNPFSISESAHNTFISLLVETGLIGILIFSAFLLALLRLLPQVPHQDRRFQIILMGCLLLTQMSTEWSMEKIAWVLYSLLISHAWLDNQQIILRWRLTPSPLSVIPKTAHV